MIYHTSITDVKQALKDRVEPFDVNRQRQTRDHIEPEEERPFVVLFTNREHRQLEGEEEEGYYIQDVKEGIVLFVRGVRPQIIAIQSEEGQDCHRCLHEFAVHEGHYSFAKCWRLLAVVRQIVTLIDVS
jgi:hypothetical protein